LEEETVDGSFVESCLEEKTPMKTGFLKWCPDQELNLDQRFRNQFKHLDTYNRKSTKSAENPHSGDPTLVVEGQTMTVWGVVLDFWVLDEVGGALEERFSWKPVLWIEGGFEPGWGTRWFVRFGW